MTEEEEASFQRIKGAGEAVLLAHRQVVYAEETHRAASEAECEAGERLTGARKGFHEAKRALIKVVIEEEA